ncbi:MAG: hypothetical protein R2713_20265 [Ilumatobacteraceae bacterium]
MRGVGVPADASAVVVNLTAVALGRGRVRDRPPVGRSAAGSVVAQRRSTGPRISNLATVRIGTDGAIQPTPAWPCRSSSTSSAPTASIDRVAAGRLETLPGGARRALDTATPRDRGRRATRTVDLAAVGVPSGATAVVVSLVGHRGASDTGPRSRTAATGRGVRSTSTSRGRPAARRRSSLPAGTRSFQVFADGWPSRGRRRGLVHRGNAAVTTDGLFVPSSPQRVLDTRTNFEIAPWGDTTIEFGTGSPFPADTAAVALNVAATDPWYVGYVTAHPAGVARPGSSNLNITSFDQIVANHAVVRPARGLAVYTQSGTHLVADVAGWYLGRPEASLLPEARAERSSPTTAVGIAAPSIGVQVAIGTHRNIDVVIDSGKAGLWLGSGAIGREEHNIYFAHRTSHGGVFRTIDRLVVGTTFSVVGADGRTYQYLVTRQDGAANTGRTDEGGADRWPVDGDTGGVPSAGIDPLPLGGDGTAHRRGALIARHPTPPEQVDHGQGEQQWSEDGEGSGQPPPRIG